MRTVAVAAILNNMEMLANTTTANYTPFFLPSDGKTPQETLSWFLDTLGVDNFQTELTLHRRAINRSKMFVCDFDPEMASFPAGTRPLYRYPGNDRQSNYAYDRYLLPMPSVLDGIRNKIFETSGQWCNHCVLNLYYDGYDYISPHMDKTRDMVDGSSIFTVSIGAETELTFHRKENGWNGYDTYPMACLPVVLEHGSMYEITADVNDRLYHSVNFTSHRKLRKRGRRISLKHGFAHGTVRLSLTFRSIGTLCVPGRESEAEEGFYVSDRLGGMPTEFPFEKRASMRIGSGKMMGRSFEEAFRCRPGQEYAHFMIRDYLGPQRYTTGNGLEKFLLYVAMRYLKLKMNVRMMKAYIAARHPWWMAVANSFGE